jgi:hypothetical protein
MTSLSTFSPGLQVVAAFVVYVIEFVVLLFSTIICLATAMLVYEGVHYIRAQTLKPSPLASRNLEEIEGWHVPEKIFSHSYSRVEGRRRAA